MRDAEIADLEAQLAALKRKRAADAA